MGYMGLSSWVESDNAADLRAAMIDSMAYTLEKGIKEKANCYNTEGCVNVALILEDKSIFGKMPDYEREYFAKAALLAKKGLEKKIKECKKPMVDKNTIMHVTAYTRMIKSINKFLKGVDLEDS